MAKNSVRDFSATAASNTDIQSVNIDESCPASGINNAIRELMADIKDVSTGAVNLETPAADSLTVTGDLTVDTNTLHVDSTNNRVGVGLTTPERVLHVNSGTNNNCALFESTDANADIYLQDSGATGNTSVGLRGQSNDLAFITNGSEAARIQSNGDFHVGKTTGSIATAGLSLRGSSDVAQFVRSGNPSLELSRLASDGEIAGFYRSTTKKGSISVASAGTTYNTTSDRRLKTDIQPIADGTDKLMQMQPVTHKWIAEPDGDAVHGFIAQDMQQICPEAVSGEDGGEEMMSMDYGRITPVLVAALQDAHRKIEELEQRLSEMEN